MSKVWVQVSEPRSSGGCGRVVQKKQGEVMLKMTKGLVLAVAILGLGACGTKLQDAEMTAPGGGAFKEALHKYYIERSSAEFAEGDYRDSDYFASKAITASGATEVLPQEVGERRIPADRVDVLTSSRERLMAALAGGGRLKAPDDAARAQVMFDCWLQEQEENFQPEDIEFCRSGFFASLRAVEAAIAEPAAAPPPPPPPAPEAASFNIYFDFDKSNIRDDQQSPLRVATLAAEAAAGRTVSLSCHTDTAGAIDYNQALSVRRCNSVTGAMIEAGIDRSRIVSFPVGQTQPLVETGDGVVEQGNRVVVITLEAN
jgi:outer membrane protein OmpA-like peptidoglycan-associated protein